VTSGDGWLARAAGLQPDSGCLRGWVRCSRPL